jgi:UDP-3-O-[3-hydroxymyristoyl] N-acetylglucosamine deacetylase
LKHEQTLRAAVGCKGIGLHSGAPVNLRILPGPSGSGIIFRRTDLDDFEIEAGSRNVARVSYATSLMKKGVLISTTEHLLSAFIGAGIDNAIVELDNLELPILDGSARPFVEMIHRAGIRKQRRERTYLRIRREFELREGDKFIAVYPADTYSVSYTINFPHPMIGKEEFRVDLSDGNYLEDIAPARTFGFVHEADVLRQQGLIRGASTDNAIVLTRDGVMNPPLRFDDEFVRPQSPRPHRRPRPSRKANPRQRRCRSRGPRHAHRPRFAFAQRRIALGRNNRRGIIRSPHLEQIPDGSPLGLNLSEEAIGAAYAVCLINSTSFPTSL